MVRPYFIAGVSGRNRVFSTVSCLRNEKLRQKFSNLGLSLLKGEVKNEEPVIDKKQEEALNPLNESYDMISHLNRDDLQVQLQLDGGRQLFLAEGNHFINRTKILNTIPDKIDIQDKSMTIKELNDIYSKLDSLDNDKTVQMKYFKRFAGYHPNHMDILRQEYNRIDLRFKSLRRRDTDVVYLTNGKLTSYDNIIKNQYNVLGIDRTISGIPLKDNDDINLPKEFVEDVNTFVDGENRFIHPAKLDVDYHEQSHKVSVNPRLTLGARNNIKSVRKTPPGIVKVESIDDYNKIDLLDYLKPKIEGRIQIMKETIYNQINKIFDASYLLFPQPRILNFHVFKLYEEKINYGAIITYKHYFTEFNTFPVSTVIGRSRRNKRLTRNFLFKLMRLHLGQLVKTLGDLKFSQSHDAKKVGKFLPSEEGKNFINDSHKDFRDIINEELMPLFKPLVLNPKYDALVYTPFGKGSFSRIYWLKKTSRNKSKRVIRVKTVDLDNNIEYKY